MNVRLHVTAGSVIAIGLLLALVATVGPPPSATEPGASLTVRLPHTVQTIVLVLFGLSAILLLALQRPRRPTEDELQPSRVHRRRSAWAIFVPLPLLVLAAAVWYLVWHRWSGGEGDPLEKAVTAIAELLDLLSRAGKPATSVPLFDFTIAAIMVLSGLALLTLLILVVLSDPLARWLAGRAAVEEMPRLSEDADDGPDNLRALLDPRVAIIRAYGRFERALAEAGAPRPPWQTPAEFMRTTVARLPVATSPVRRLTALLEVARFSNRTLELAARDTACDCLDEIRAVLRAHSRSKE